MGAETRRAQARAEAAALLRAVADPRLPNDMVKTQIARAAERLGWSYARTQDIWRQQAHRIEAWEMDVLRGYRPPQEDTPTRKS